MSVHIYAKFKSGYVHVKLLMHIIISDGGNALQVTRIT